MSNVKSILIDLNTNEYNYLTEIKNKLNLSWKNLLLYASGLPIKTKNILKGKEHHNYGKIPPPSYGKRCYYNSLLQGEICFRSTYELKFAHYLNKNNIPWLYEIETFDLDNTTYTPDFYLPTCDLFIEIKGYMRPEAQEKINKFLDIYHEETLLILRKEDLIKLGININYKY